MNKPRYGILGLACAAAGWLALASAQPAGREPSPRATAVTLSTPQAQTQATVAAATAFLNTLSAKQRGKVQVAFAPQPTATAAKFKGGPSFRVVSLASARRLYEIR